MNLGCTGWVLAGYFVHFLAMYLQCSSPGHHPLPPVRAYVAAFRTLLVFSPVVSDEIAREGNDTTGIGSFLEAARSSTRRSHSTAVKDLIGNWHHFNPALMRMKDSHRGWEHEECARLLSPPFIEWNEAQVIPSSFHPPSNTFVVINRTYLTRSNVRNSSSVQAISRGSPGRGKRRTTTIQLLGFCVTPSCLL